MEESTVEPKAEPLDSAPPVLEVTNRIWDYIHSVNCGRGRRMMEAREIDDLIRAEFAQQGIDNIATKERDEFHPITFYARHFGMFLSDVFGPEHRADTIRVEYSKRGNVQSGYWVQIQWKDGDGQNHYAESQWHKLAWERAMKEFNSSVEVKATSFECDTCHRKSRFYINEESRYAGPGDSCPFKSDCKGKLLPHERSL